jgi:hypothetical protein
MTRMKRMMPLVCLGLLAAPFGCSSEGNVNIGNTETIGGRLSDYVGTWTGYAQATVFSDGSDHVSLTIDGNGHGTALFGNGAPPAVPTDPQVGPPVPAPSPNAPASSEIPGFAYPIHGTIVQSDRIQLGIDFNDFYAPWCALQTPQPAMNVPTSDTGYYCGPALGSNLVKLEKLTPDATTCTMYLLDGTTLKVNCDWANLCAVTPVCTCTSSACTAIRTADGSALAQYPAEIDGQLDAAGTTLTGTLGHGGGTTIVLHKQN